MSATNYEKWYTDTKQELEQTKIENDEILKEYESTIKMWEESVERWEKEKTNLDNKWNEALKANKQWSSDVKNYKEKNLDKMKDIEQWSTKNDKLNEEIKRVHQNKSLIDSKIVTLENDNDHFLNKIREYEATIEDLNSKLESALEENISLQTDYETYKQSSEEQFLRKEEELKEAKNEIWSKDKIIANWNRKDSMTMKQLYSKNNQEQKSSVLLESNYNNGNTKNKGSRNKKSVLVSNVEVNRTWSEGNTNIVTPVVGSNKKLPEKFMQIYRKSFQSNNIDFDKKAALKEIRDVETVKEKEGDGEESDSGSNSNKSSMNEKRNFDCVEIEKNANLEFVGKALNKAEDKVQKRNNDAIVDNLKQMLSRIQQRKTILVNNKRVVKEKMEKIGIKTR